MTNGPALPGSPETTAKVDPLGSPGGPAIHLSALACAGAAPLASNAATLAINNLVISEPPCGPTPARGHSMSCRIGPLGLMAAPSEKTETTREVDLGQSFEQINL